MNKRNYSTPFRVVLAHACENSRRFSLVTSVVLGLSTGVAWADLPKNVTKTLSRYNIPESSVSAVVVPLSSSKVLLSHRAETPRNPASTMKLLTTFAALDILGPAHSWDTEYFINGTLHRGVLDGDLVIKGRGDPFLAKEQFWLHLAALRELGLKKIKGNLLIDSAAFSLMPYDAGAFDQRPNRLYNVGPSATLINFNASRFRLQPVETGIKVLLDPPVHNVVINNQLKAAKGKCRDEEEGWSIDVARENDKAYVAFSGHYRTQCGTFDLNRSVLSSEAYLYGLFTYLWRNLGGEFDGGFAQAEVKEGANAFYTGNAKTLAEVINGTNKYSNNLLARQLLLAIGYHYFGAGTSVEDSVRSLKTWFSGKGLNLPELVMENGAGLSRQILLSARSLSELLVYASKSVYHPEFLASFSLGGLDGTMRKRLEKLKLGGRARLKTGYIRDVRSLAGYIRADSGNDYAVVLFIQGPQVDYSKGNRVQDAFMKWVIEAG